MFRKILVHEDDRKFQRILWRFDANEEVKSWSLNTVTYGMVSSPFLAIRVDFFSLSFNLNNLKDKIAKRDVLSCITKFFDPLGWFIPVIITAKIFIQKLCLAKLSWDEPLSQELKNEFLDWYSGVPVLRNIKISR